MALISDFIKETTTTTGTGDLTLSAAQGFARFSDAFVAEDNVYYSIYNGINRETGVGTVKAGNILERSTPQKTLVAGVFDDATPVNITLVGVSEVYLSATASLFDSKENVSTAATLDASHIADADPHTQYQKASEIDALISSNTYVIANTFSSHTHANETVLTNTAASFLVTQETKINHITVTQAVNLDTIESDTTTNNAKSTNVSTDLSIGTKTTTTVHVNSSDGTNATIPAATVSEAGLLSAFDKTKIDAIAGTNTGDQDLSGYQPLATVLTNTAASFLVAQETKINHITVTQAVNLDTIESDTTTNNAKATNVSTDLSIGTKTTTTVDVNSSDGTNATMPAATVSEAGLLSAFDKNKIDHITIKSTSIFLGVESGILDDSTSNTNTGFGYHALKSVTSGNSNVGVGSYSLRLNSTGYSNVSLGHQSSYSNTTGDNNVALGIQTLFSNVDGSKNVAICTSALTANTSGSFNIAIGYQSMITNTTGSYLISMGYQALKNNSSGGTNIGVGYQALRSNTVGSNNLGMGYVSLWSNIGGSDNVGYGIQTLYSNTEGDNNTAVGTKSLYYNTTGSNNTAIGHHAGERVTSGASNITSGTSVYVGSYTKSSADGNSNEIAIGYSTDGNGSNTATLGNDDIGDTYLKGTVHSNAGKVNNLTTVNTATYNLLVTDYMLHVTYTTTAAVTSLTLPSAQVVVGRTIKIKDAAGSAATNNITIDTDGAETIDGASTKIINVNYESVEIYSDGANWFVL